MSLKFTVTASLNLLLGQVFSTILSPSTLPSRGPMWSTASRPEVPGTRKHTKLVEQVQRRATKKIRGLEPLSYEEKLSDLGSFRLERRKLRGDLIVVF